MGTYLFRSRVISPLDLSPLPDRAGVPTAKRPVRSAKPPVGTSAKYGTCNLLQINIETSGHHPPSSQETLWKHTVSKLSNYFNKPLIFLFY